MLWLLAGAGLLSERRLLGLKHLLRRLRVGHHHAWCRRCYLVGQQTLDQARRRTRHRLCLWLWTLWLCHRRSDDLLLLLGRDDRACWGGHCSHFGWCRLWLDVLHVASSSCCCCGRLCSCHCRYNMRAIGRHLLNDRAGLGRWCSCHHHDWCLAGCGKRRLVRGNRLEGD